MNEPVATDELMILIPNLASQGNIELSFHAEQRLNQPDRNFTFEKLLLILKNPKTITTEWDEKRGEYKYKVKGRRRHAVVTLIVSNTYINVVTVF
ncbi:MULTISPECIES: DUF4258 domain-containing protein [unclassified Paenibacillus]|uniref:DUF4258 domain-containing protein n=1 Tax=unclassified Paenibacillus TaxID=185978 RepID=UPI000FE1D352|nr:MULTISPECIES: DUF4258 domain-containing protein [unclassified Paenibacillus]MCM3171927.1 DUF4258 domain-containing protein [Paenibacillus sp. MER 99-2]